MAEMSPHVERGSEVAARSTGSRDAARSESAYTLRRAHDDFYHAHTGSMPHASWLWLVHWTPRSSVCRPGPRPPFGRSPLCSPHPTDGLHAPCLLCVPTADTWSRRGAGARMSIPLGVLESSWALTLCGWF